MGMTEVGVEGVAVMVTVVSVSQGVDVASIGTTGREADGMMVVVDSVSQGIEDVS